MLFRYLSLLMLVLISIEVTSQDPVAINYTTKDGLLSNNIYYVMQDSKGFLWICTDKGVSRFDGKNFKNFGIEEGLDGQAIFICYEDHEGRIWFGSHAPALFYLHKDEVKQYEYNNIIKNYCKAKRVITTLRVEKSEKIIVGFQYDGYLEINNNGQSQKTAEIDGKVVEVRDDFLLNYSYNSREVNVVSTKQISIKRSDSVLRYFENVRMPFGNKGPSQYSLLIDQKLFISNHNILYVLEKNEIKAIEFNFIIDCLVKNGENELFVGFLGGGINHYIDKDDLDRFEKYYVGKSVTSIVKIEGDGYWIGTRGSGLLKVTSFSNRVIKGRNSNSVSDYHFNSDEIIVGFCDGSLIAYNRNKKTTELLMEHKLKRTDVPLFFERRDNGQILIEVLNSQDFNIYSKRIEFIAQDKTAGFIKDYSISQDESIWAITSSYLYHISKLGIQKKMSNKYFNNEVLNFKKLIRDLDGFLWLCTSNGIVIFNHKDEFAGRILEGYCINDILFHNEKIFITTCQNGIMEYSNFCLKYRPEFESLEQVTSLSINEDFLWIVSENNFLFTSLKEKKYLLQNIDYPPLKSQVEKISFSGNEILLATNEGFQIIDRLNFINYQLKSDTVPIDFGNMWINSLSIKNEDLKNILEIETDDTLIIQFNENEAFNQTSKDIEYRLLPSMRDWKKIDQNKVFLTSFKPDFYRLQFRCYSNKNSANILSSQELDFVVEKPFFNRFNVNILISICIVFTVYIVGEYSNFSVKENVLKDRIGDEEINFLKLKALYAQMNPHFTFNILNSLQALVLKNKKKESIFFLNKYSKMLRNILLGSQGPLLELSKELEILERYVDMENLRFQDRINLEINQNSVDEKSDIKIPSMILQPVVENSIKHGLKREDNSVLNIDVNISKKADAIFVSIMDDGIGYSISKSMRKNENHQSFGMSIIKERLEILNKDSKEEYFEVGDLIKNNEVQGTIVSLRFPIKEKN